MRTRRSKQFKPQEKSRPVRCNIGDALTCVYNASNGMTYVGPNYPEYTKRLNEDTCLQLYKTARSSIYATSLSAYMDVLGREEIVGVAGNRKAYTNCTHRKIGTLNLPYLVMTKSHKSSAYYYFDYYRRSTSRGYATYLGSQTDELARQYEVGHDKMFSARAFWSMRPKFEGTVSIINSIFELKDFKDVVNVSKQVKNFRHVASSQLFSAYRREFNKLARNSNIRATLHERGLGNYADMTPAVLGTLARDVSGTAAAATLTMNLAVKPTISDVMAIAAQFATSTMEMQKTFHEYGELGSTSHFSEDTLIKAYTRHPTSDYNWASGSHYKIKQTATMRSYYSYKLRSQNEALVKYWGLAGTAEALWNMLPLGFVLDYIFTVGKSLEYMMTDENVTDLTTEYCESVKIICSDGLSLIQDSAVPAFVLDGVYHRPTTHEKPHLVSGTQCTRYTRKVMEPYKGPALPKFKLPSNSQAANVLALARCFMN